MGDQSTNDSITETHQSVSFVTIFDNDVGKKVFQSFHILLGIICVFGVFFNILNMIVFLKQGLNTSTNIALMSLAIIDMCNILDYLLGLMTISDFVAVAAENVIVPLELALMLTYPHSTFVPIKSWINVFMTTERCLCIALPLKIKQIINPRKTAVSMLAIYILIISVSIPVYTDLYFDWKYYPYVNRTLLGVKYRTNDEKYILSPVNLFLGIILISSFPVVILLTSILIWKLRTVSKWRIKSTRQMEQSDVTSQRDKMVIRLVVVIATFLIISLTPSVLYTSMNYLLPGFSLLGKYYQIFILIGDISTISDASNSSFNIFIYYKMSSNYKQIFSQQFFGKNVQEKRISTVTSQKDIKK